MKINYDLLMQKQIENSCGKKKLLLHSCCAPCSTAVLDALGQIFDITVYYYNPNIYPETEFIKRSENQVKLIKQLKNIKLIVCSYDETEFLNEVKGLEKEKEGQKRCPICFALRLEQTAKFAKDNGFDFFGTTLTISPHKNEQQINSIGQSLSTKYNIDFLFSDFKKHEGYKKSIMLSKKYELYRQTYCGCRFSLGE